MFWCNLSGGAAAPQADLDAWLTSFYNAYVANLGAQEGNSVNIVQAQATLFQTGGAVLESTHAGAGTGTNGAPEVNDNSACYVVSWKTNVYWRGGKPRTYLPGVLNGVVTNGTTLSGATVTAVTTKATAFRTAINALSQGAITATQLGFVSFFFQKGTLRNPPVFFAFTGAGCHPRIGTQRRRLGRWQI